MRQFQIERKTDLAIFMAGKKTIGRRGCYFSLKKKK